MKRFFVLWFLVGCATCFAQFDPLLVPDSSEIRKSVAENWFYPSLDAIRDNKTEIRSNSLGERFQVRLEETDNNFAVIVAPEIFMDVVVYTENGTSNTVSAEYPVDASGSWVLIRNSLTGKIESLRIYFGSNSDVYVQFYEDSRKVFSDFVVCGSYTNRGVPLGINFDSLLTMSFSDIYRLTKDSLAWKYVDIRTGLYEDKRQMMGVIRKLKNKIVYADNACYDEYGKPIYITNGEERIVDGEDIKKGNISVSSAGFLKWIIDGLCIPLNGAGTYIAPLRRETISLDPLSYAANVSRKGVPTNFTLDWTRNLAAARLSVQSRKNYLYEQSGVDVTIEPFTAEITENGPKQIVSYIKDSGYQIERLKPVLYILGVTEPNYAYLAAIRRVVPAQNGKPEYYFFDQCAVIFPYFDKNGRFACAIFDNGQELTIAQFLSRYKDSFVHLSRFNCSSKFAPLGLQEN